MMPNPSQEPPESSEAPNDPSDHIQIKIMMPKPSQEPPVSSKAPNQDLNGLQMKNGALYLMNL